MNLPFPPQNSCVHRNAVVTLVLLAGVFALSLHGSEALSETPPNSTATLTGVPADYRLAPGDLVGFQIFNEPDMASSQRVTAQGEVRLPLVGTVHVADLSLRDAEAKLEQLYKSAEFFVDPLVILTVGAYVERAISVLGQVNNPGRIPLPFEMKSVGLMEAVAQAGGFTRIADLGEIQVNRPAADEGSERIIVNIQQYISAKKDPKLEAFRLLPGDVVYVPERAF